MAPFSPNLAPVRQTAAKTFDEHQVCLALVEAVRAQVVALPTGFEGEWRTELARRLRAMADGLAAHFASEEQGWLFQGDDDGTPQEARKLDRLRSEHPVVLEKARALADAAPRMPAIELAADALRLVATLRRHEAEETELMVHAAWDDLAASD